MQIDYVQQAKLLIFQHTECIEEFLKAENLF